MKKFEQLLFVIFLFGFVCTASAMDSESPESQHLLIGPASMNYLKSQSQELHKPVNFHIIIASPDEDDTMERNFSIADSSQLPNELTVAILEGYLQDLNVLFEGYFKNYGGARIHINGWFPDTAYKATGFDYVEPGATQ